MSTQSGKIKVEKFYQNFKDGNKMELLTLGDLIKYVRNQERTCEMNNVDPDTVPVTIKNISTHDEHYILNWMWGLSIGHNGKVKVSAEIVDSDLVDYYDCQDSRPGVDNAEFWKSRGPSGFDVSGYVVSKEAGQRLLNMVDEVLGTKDHKTYLDWRKYEPNYIQFKFDANEFDCEMLHNLSKSVDGERKYLTKEMLIKAKLTSTDR